MIRVPVRMRVLYFFLSPFIWPILGRNGNIIVTRKRHDQKEKGECRSPGSETITLQSPFCRTPLSFIVYYHCAINACLQIEVTPYININMGPCTPGPGTLDIVFEFTATQCIRTKTSAYCMCRYPQYKSHKELYGIV